MSERRVPSWFTVLGPSAQAEQLYAVFVDLLHHLPLNSSELARRLNVSQPAVSRWTSGASHPSLEQMEAAIELIYDTVREMMERASRVREVFALVDRAILIADCQCVPSMEFCDTCGLRSNAVQEELRDIQGKLSALLRDYLPDERN